MDPHKIGDAPEFKGLVASRWTVAGALTLLVFIIYYGFILLIGYAPEAVAGRIGEATTWGILMTVLVILFSFVLTVVYVLWANKVYDPKVSALQRALEE